jgi:hypothetical protein
VADRLPFQDLPEVALPVTARAPRLMPLVSESDWTVVDHVCKACMGRLVGRAGEAGRFYRCTNCGASSPPGEPPVMSAPPPSARRHPSICACSIRFGGRDAGIRCTVNTAKGADNPAEIVARQL